MDTFHTFPDAVSARAYRRTHGTGGWIFEDEATGQATIFPWRMTPTAIFAHPIAAHKTGNLIGCS